MYWNKINIIKSAYELLSFKSVTYYDRWFEISLGIMAWINIFILLFVILK